MIRIDGASDSTVISAISWIARSVTPPLPWPPRLMLMSCAARRPSQQRRLRSRSATKRTLRGNGAGLTKTTISTGQAGSPSRLPDCRMRCSAAAAGGGGGGADRRRASRSAAIRYARAGRTGGDRSAGGAAVSPAGRRSAASSRCAISARLWSALGGSGAAVPAHGAAAAASARRPGGARAAASVRRAAGSSSLRGIGSPRGRGSPRGMGSLRWAFGRHRWLGSLGARFGSAERLQREARHRVDDPSLRLPARRSRSGARRSDAAGRRTSSGNGCRTGRGGGSGSGGGS